jgi:hypothetical protein
LREQFVKALTIGIAIVVVAVGAILFMQRGAHMNLTGPMTVRIHATDKDTALAIIDVHLTNAADYGFQVSDVTATLETKAGDSTSRIVSNVDAKRLVEAMPELGPFHPTLYTKYVIPPHSTGDYTLLAQFSLPDRMLADRQRFVVRIQEINGKTAELLERP